MIEVYAFLAVFTAQILVMSVMCPAWFVKYVRAQAATIPADRFAQLEPEGDPHRTLDRYLRRYCMLNMGLMALGFLLMSWLFNYMQRLDWDDGPVEALVGVYFMAQALPFGFVALVGYRYKGLKHLLLERKRTAVLEPRGLFDFVSPLTVSVAIVAYLLFVAYVIYIAQNPFPGFSGYITVAGITLVYLMNAFVVYWQLYGRKPNPFESHANRARTIGLGVKACVYSSIAIVTFMSLNFTLVLLDLQRWEPALQCAFFLIAGPLSFLGFTAPPRGPEANGRRNEQHLAPRTRDLSA